MKKILWVSRHQMTNEQLNDLHRIYGEFSLTQFDQTVETIESFLTFHADVYAVVLPLQLLADLKKATDAEIIQPVSGRVRTESAKYHNQASDTLETEYIFKHLYWQKINRLELETEKL